MTNQERKKILEMFASGKLTIEQADQLLERLGAQSLADAENRPDQRQRAAGFTNFTGEQMAALDVYEVDADDIVVEGEGHAVLLGDSVKELYYINSKRYKRRRLK